MRSNNFASFLTLVLLMPTVVSCLDILGFKDPVLQDCSDMNCSGGGGNGGGSSVCDPGEKRPCYSGPMGTADVGICKSGVETCSDDGSGFGVCEDEVKPKEEDCSNLLDDDCSGTACAEALWGKSFEVDGSGESLLLIRVGVDSGSNTYVAGFFEGSATFGESLATNGDRHMYLVKLDVGGQPLWSRAFGSGSLGKLIHMKVKDDRVVVAVDLKDGTIDFGNGSVGPLGTAVAVLDTDGKAVWTRHFDSLLGPNALAVDSDSNEVVIAGGFSGTADFGNGNVLTSQGDSEDIYVAKLSDSGVTLWAKAFGDADAANSLSQAASSVSVDSGKNILVGGNFSGTMDIVGFLTAPGAVAPFLMKLGPDGTPDWSRIYGTPETTSSTPMVIAASAQDDGVILGGVFAGGVNFSGTPKLAASDVMYLVKSNKDGNYLWAHYFGETVGFLFDVTTDAMGNVVAVGTFAGDISFGDGLSATSKGDGDVFVVKYSANGDYIWSKTTGSAAAIQFATSVAVELKDNSIRVTGPNNGTVDFGGGPLVAADATDIFVAKIAP